MSVLRRWGPSAAAVALVLVATMVPSREPKGSLLRCIICGEEGVADAIANVVMFLPVGLAFGSASRRSGRAILAAVVLSAAVELIQSFGIPGRDASIGDVLFNTLGGILGLLVARSHEWWLNPPLHRGLWLGSAAAAAATVVVLLTGLLSRLSLPDTSWFSQWTGQFGDMAYYNGRVTDARSARRFIPSYRLDDSGALRRDVLGGVPLVVTVVSSPPTPAIAAIFSVSDQHQRRMLLLGADGPDLVFYVGHRATDFRFVEPALRVPRALDGVRGGQVLTLEIRREGRGFCVGLQRDLRCGLGITAGMGWQLIVGWGWLRRYTVWFDALWVCALLVPVGFWLRLRWPSLVAVGLVIGAAPLFSGLVPSRPTEWLAAAGGVVVGHWLRSRA